MRNRFFNFNLIKSKGTIGSKNNCWDVLQNTVQVFIIFEWEECHFNTP